MSLIQFTNYLNEVGSEFGGYPIISNVLSEDSISNLITYPGFIYIVKPWSPKINLVNLGYVLNTRYTVFDNKKNKLYSARSNSGFFGDTYREGVLLNEASHMSYWYILLETEDGPLTGLIWISKVIPNSVKQAAIDSWSKQRTVLNNALYQHEAFIEVSNLSIEDSIKTYFVTGLQAENYIPSEIKQHPNVQIFIQKADRVFTLYPKLNGWYYFEHISKKNITTALTLENIVGPNTDRFKTYGKNTYYVELNHISSNRKKISYNKNTEYSRKSYDELYLNDFIHLEATFQLEEPYILIGSSSATAEIVVKRQFENQSTYLSASAVALIANTFNVLDITGNSSTEAEFYINNFVFESTLTGNSVVTGEFNVVPYTPPTP